jgi:hypothetical protein
VLGLSARDKAASLVVDRLNPGGRLFLGPIVALDIHHGAETYQAHAGLDGGHRGQTTKSRVLVPSRYPFVSYDRFPSLNCHTAQHGQCQLWVGKSHPTQLEAVSPNRRLARSPPGATVVGCVVAPTLGLGSGRLG